MNYIITGNKDVAKRTLRRHPHLPQVGEPASVVLEHPRDLDATRPIQNHDRLIIVANGPWPPNARKAYEALLRQARLSGVNGDTLFRVTLR